MNPKDHMGSAKPNISIIPPAPMYEVCAALTEGACKYGKWNWRDQQISETIYVDASIRHLTQYLSGEDDDKDSGLSHITKAIAGLVILRDAQIHGCSIDNRGPMSNLQMEFIVDKIAAIHEKYPSKPREPITTTSRKPPIELVDGGLEAVPSLNLTEDLTGVGVTFTDGRKGTVDKFDPNCWQGLIHRVKLDCGQYRYYNKTGAIDPLFADQRDSNDTVPTQIASVDTAEQRYAAMHAERVAEEAAEAEAESKSLNSRRTEAGGGSFVLDKNIVAGTKVLMSNDTEGKVTAVDSNADYLPVEVRYGKLGEIGSRRFWFGPTGYLDNEEDNQYDNVHVVEVLGK